MTVKELRDILDNYANDTLVCVADEGAGIEEYQATKLTKLLPLVWTNEQTEFVLMLQGERLSVADGYIQARSNGEGGSKYTLISFDKLQEGK